MAVTIAEALYLMRSLGVEYVSVDGLIDTFVKTNEQPTTEQEEEIHDLPELPEPTRPAETPESAPEEPKRVTVYKEYSEAKKAAKKGQKPVLDEKLGGYVIMEV